MSRIQSKKQPESFDGLFSAFPHVVFESDAFKGATNSAKSLIFPLIRQLNGKNNGHLQLTPQWLKEQGYTSSTVYSARDELIAREIILQTRWGGLQMGANLYAVTWLPISNFIGLDITEQGYQRGGWGRCKLPPTPRRSKPINNKRDAHYDNRNNLDTITGTGGSNSATTTVTKKTLPLQNSTTTIVNNVVNTNTLLKLPKRIVGVKGRSGISNPLSAND